MSLIPEVGDDSWLSELSALKRLSQDINSKITERNSKNAVAGKVLFCDMFWYLYLFIFNDSTT